MPRNYTCKACHTIHAPPTGKACQRVATALHEGQAGDQSQEVMSVLMGLQKQMAEMQEEFQQMREKRDDVEVSEQGSEEEESEETGEETDEGATAATPHSVRSDIRLMARAAERLNRLSVDELEEEEGQDIGYIRTRGKKSGLVMLASDIVKKQIDWPHLYVTRMVQGDRKPVAYRDLKVEEFVYGFIEMLRAPNCKLDIMRMIDILSMVMQDTVDFSWSNARGFYEKVGLDVEKAGLKWTDTNRIDGMRVVYSRTVFPEAKENKDSAKGGNKPTQANIRCCALFQRNACENQRDHFPFKHACAHCYKACSGIFRHAEADCHRKASEAAKNKQRRE